MVPGLKAADFQPLGQTGFEAWVSRPIIRPMPCLSCLIREFLVDQHNRGSWCCCRGSYGYGHQGPAITDWNDGSIASTLQARTGRLRFSKAWFQILRCCRTLPKQGLRWVG